MSADCSGSHDGVDTGILTWLQCGPHDVCYIWYGEGLGALMPASNAPFTAQTSKQLR